MARIKQNVSKDLRVPPSMRSRQRAKNGCIVDKDFETAMEMLRAGVAGSRKHNKGQVGRLLEK